MNKIIRIPADHSPETIKDVFTIVMTLAKKGTGHVDTRIVHLDGTIEEKLQQFKDATGNDWNGFEEQVFGVQNNIEPISLNLGNVTPTLIMKPDKETQDKIDALTAQAQRWIEESQTAKSRWVTPKEVEALTT